MNNIISLKTLTSFGVNLSRSYAFKSDLKIKWVRPEKIPCIHPSKSGDLSALPPLNPKEIIPGFRESKELENASETVKSLFTIENNPRKLTSDLYREMLVKEVQRHPLDWGSMEAKLARMTATIRRFQEHMENFPRDKRIKVMLKETIDKRKKYLKYLRRWDYRRFEWILEKLDLVYKPPPNEFHWITRKDSLRKLTDIHCENLKKERLEKYRQYLESQQEDFLERKIKNLEFIKKGEEECEVPVTVTQKDINAVKTQLADLRAKKASLESSEKN